jgi:Flp pilus assembly protein TadG
VITGWLLKVVLGIAIVGFLVMEIGSPLITKAQLDDAAHQAADQAALELFSSRNAERAEDIAIGVADRKRMTLESFSIDERGDIHVKVSKTARSLLFGKIDATKKFYEVDAQASASPSRIR